MPETDHRQIEGSEAEAPFAQVELPTEEEPAEGPRGPLIRPLTMRHVAAGAGLTLIVEIACRRYLDFPWAGVVLGLAMLLSAAIKFGLRHLIAQTTVQLPAILWNEFLRLAADLALFYVLLRIIAAILLSASA